MDQVRQIRYLVAPFFFFASLLWGYYLSKGQLPTFSHATNTAGNTVFEIAPLVTLIVASFFPIGFLIGALSHLLVLGFFKLWTGRYSEVFLRDAAFRRVWKDSGLRHSPHRRFEFYASATFDHEILHDRVHQWIMRVWSAFVISTHSAIALFVALLLGLWPKIGWTWQWVVSTLIACIVLLLNARVTWRRCIEMIEFQSLRPAQEKRDKEQQN